MAYTYKQLVMAYEAAHGGIAPSPEVASQLRLLTNASYTDADRLNYILNSADKTTAVAVLSYQFFTGKAPSAEGIAYLLRSGPSNLNSETYAKFNLENRFMNFATNLALEGEGKAAFESKYGAMTYAQYVAAIYDTIIGKAQAAAAGLNAEQTIADIIARQDLILLSARNNGVIGPNATQAEIDLALKAATAAYLLAEGIKADVGIYAGATNNFMLALATGKAVYGVDITQIYAPSPTSGSTGGGKAVDTPPPADALPGGPQPETPTAPQPLSFVLTTGVDTFTGADTDDTFTATHLTLNAGDVLDGGAGNDTLTLTSTLIGAYVLPGATVSGIETLVIDHADALTANTAGWAGLTQLTVTTQGETTLRAAAATDVTLDNTNQGGADITLDGGHDVSLTLANSVGAIRIGDSVSPTGAVVINRTMSDTTADVITVFAGTSVEVNLTAANAVNTTLDTDSIQIYGSVLTTSVKLKGSNTIAVGANRAGHDGDDFSIYDVNSGGSSGAGAITSVEADGFSTLAISDTALTTLKISHGGYVTLYNSPIASSATTLNATLDAIDGRLQDDGGYQTLNLTMGPSASNLTLDMAALRTLTLAGTGALTLLNDLTSATNADLTLVDGSAATGALDLIVEAAAIAVSTGSGTDKVALLGTVFSQAVDLGAGNDQLTLRDAGATLPTATIDGGDGIDTLVMDAGDAEAFSASPAFAGQVVNFEILSLTGAASQTIDLDQLGGFNHVVTSGATDLKLTGMRSGGTVELNGDGTRYTVSGAFAGTDDSLNLRLVDADAMSNVNFASTGLAADGVEHYVITTVDGGRTPSNITGQLTLTSGGIETIVASGNAGLRLTVDSAALTSIDFSGVTRGEVELDILDGSSTALTVKGSATRLNDVNVSNVTGVITYDGGSRDDVIAASNGNAANVFHLGAGTNYFEGDAGEVTAGNGDDYIRVNNGGVTIDAGDGGNVVIALSNTASTITAGSGDDKIYVGAGANVIDVGSGTDRVQVGGVSTATAFSTITGLDAGDILELAPQIAVTLNQTTMGAKLSLAANATWQQYLDAATATSNGADGVFSWFQFEDDTYVVLDNSANATFDASRDMIVKLTGTVDLSASTLSSGEIHL